MVTFTIYKIVDKVQYVTLYNLVILRRQIERYDRTLFQINNILVWRLYFGIFIISCPKPF